MRTRLRNFATLHHAACPHGYDGLFIYSLSMQSKANKSNDSVSEEKFGATMNLRVIAAVTLRLRALIR